MHFTAELRVEPAIVSITSAEILMETVHPRREGFVHQHDVVFMLTEHPAKGSKTHD